MCVCMCVCVCVCVCVCDRRLDERRKKAIAKRKGLDQESLMELTDLKGDIVVNVPYA